MPPIPRRSARPLLRGFAPCGNIGVVGPDKDFRCPHYSIVRAVVGVRAGAVAVYVFVMVLVRVSGPARGGTVHAVRPGVAADPIGNAVQNGINGGDNSLTGAGDHGHHVDRELAFIVASRSRRRVERLIEGVPVVLARDGKMFERVLREQLVSDADFHKRCASTTCRIVGRRPALLETNGTISVVPSGTAAAIAPPSTSLFRR